MKTNQVSQPQTPTTPTLPPTTNTLPQPTPKKKTPWLLISFTILLLSATGVLGYQNYKLKQQLDNLSQPTLPSSPQLVVSSPSPIQSPALESSQIPDDWSYQTNGECGVKFPIPPKIKPYFQPRKPNRQPSVTSEEGSARFWDFPRGAIYPTMLSKVAQYELTKQASATYAAVGEASGYISQAVSVGCAPNNNQFKTNQEFIDELSSKLDEHNKSDAEKGMQPNTYLITSKNPTNRWDQQVIDLTVKEDNQVKEYSLFITPQHIYQIVVVGQTQDKFVQETAKTIFENLQFN